MEDYIVGQILLQSATEDGPHCGVMSTDQTCWWPSATTFCWWLCCLMATKALAKESGHSSHRQQNLSANLQFYITGIYNQVHKRQSVMANNQLFARKAHLLNKWFFATSGLIVTFSLDLLLSKSTQIIFVPKCTKAVSWWNSHKQFVRYCANKLSVYGHAHILSFSRTYRTKTESLRWLITRECIKIYLFLYSVHTFYQLVQWKHYCTHQS